jgi:hypothetical protein
VSKAGRLIKDYWHVPLTVLGAVELAEHPAEIIDAAAHVADKVIEAADRMRGVHASHGCIPDDPNVVERDGVSHRIDDPPARPPEMPEPEL